MYMDDYQRIYEQECIIYTKYAMCHLDCKTIWRFTCLIKSTKVHESKLLRLNN